MRTVAGQGVEEETEEEEEEYNMFTLPSKPVQILAKQIDTANMRSS